MEHPRFLGLLMRKIFDIFAIIISDFRTYVYGKRCASAMNAKYLGRSPSGSFVFQDKNTGIRYSGRDFIEANAERFKARMHIVSNSAVVCPKIGISKTEQEAMGDILEEPNSFCFKYAEREDV